MFPLILGAGTFLVVTEPMTHTGTWEKTECLKEKLSETAPCWGRGKASESLETFNVTKMNRDTGDFSIVRR